MVAPPPFPTLTVATPRLQVRPVEPGDAEAVAEVFADKQTQRWLPVPAGAGTVDGAAWSAELAERARAGGDGDHYGVIRREDSRLVGCLWTRRTDWTARATEIAYASQAATRSAISSGSSIWRK